MASSAPPRRPKRKRVRKSRTAVVSSSDSSSEDEKAAPEAPHSVSPKAHSHALPQEEQEKKGGYATDSGSEFDQEAADTEENDADFSDLRDALSPPTLRLHTEGNDEEGDVALPKTRVGGRLANLSAQSISQELEEKQHASFRTLWMQALTEEFGNELDQMRQVCLFLLTQNDARLSSESAGASNATARIPLLIDALSFGSEVFSGPRRAEPGVDMEDDPVDEMSIALPAQT